MLLQHQFVLFYACTIITAGWKCSIKTFFFLVKNTFLWENVSFSRNVPIFHRENVNKIHSFRSSQWDSKYFSLSSWIKTLPFRSAWYSCVYVRIAVVHHRTCSLDQLLCCRTHTVQSVFCQYLCHCARATQDRTPSVQQLKSHLKPKQIVRVISWCLSDLEITHGV